jgi:hypothetical protein
MTRPRNPSFYYTARVENLVQREKVAIVPKRIAFDVMGWSQDEDLSKPVDDSLCQRPRSGNLEVLADCRGRKASSSGTPAWSLVARGGSQRELGQEAFLAKDILMRFAQGGANQPAPPCSTARHSRELRVSRYVAAVFTVGIYSWASIAMVLVPAMIETRTSGESAK